ncbi:hypothetical protein BVC93_05340 [Mycobacterium sp. MS1601]|uniref:DoxX family protein n=1 Tax=Mycobacterium sp. MS1601 TaxID=1936029 RepID=UPI0009796C31|nr:DoxX family protein [Mycobacterium sp. MS1601]AQA01949.1 hypothetical protein BVC93_05340 [Mycobacterium sp. MS1601]
MTTLTLVVTLLTAAANIGIAAADLARAPFVLANSAEVGVATRWITPLALCKAAGGVGLIVGLVGPPEIGLAAATGLVVFFVGAVAVHVKTRVLHNLGFPLAYLLLAVATLGLTGAQYN